MKILPYKFLSSRRNKKTTPKLVSGFTLVELLITISIFVIITGVVLVNSKSFDNSVLLHNFAYDVAITVKQAQSYGVNISENNFGTFNSSYGVYFDLTQSRTNFVLFNDIGTSPNLKYDSNLTSCLTSDSECIQKYSMIRGTSIQDICVGDNEGNCSSVNQLSILFQRPNLGAMIYKDNETNNKSYAKIVLSSANGSTASVVVTSVGQIYVKK